jgi:uncharacterized protein YndB with AHSA1/START domain
MGEPAPDHRDQAGAPIAAVDGRMPVDYYQFLIVGPGGIDFDEPPSVTGNGLVDVRGDGLVVHCGTHYGQVRVHIEFHDREPPPRLDQWDEVVDVSIPSSHGELRCCELMDGINPELPNLAFRGPGDYRIRLCARGRDQAHEHQYDMVKPDPPLEEHAILVWPAALAPARVHQHIDGIGGGFRGERYHYRPVERYVQDYDDLIARLGRVTAQPTPPASSGTTTIVRDRRAVGAPVAVTFRIVHRSIQFWLGSGGNYDERIGGRTFSYQPRLERGAGGPVALISFAAVEPERRVAFTLAWQQHPNQWTLPEVPTLVEVTMRPDGDRTVVAVAQHGVPVELAGDMQVLWRYLLRKLELQATAPPWPPRRVHRAGTRHGL